MSDFPEYGQRQHRPETFRFTEESSRLVVETIPGLIAVLTPDGEVEHVNRPVLDYFGRSLEELKKWGTTDAVHPDDLPQTRIAWRQAVETGLPYEWEHRLRRADGEYRWFLARALPLRDPDGHVVRWFNLLTETQPRRQSGAWVPPNFPEYGQRREAEATLRSMEESSRVIVETIPGLIAVLTPDGEVDHVNHQVLEYFGRSLEELKKWGTTDAVHPDDLPQVVVAWQHAVATGSPYECEHRLRRADGEYRWFAARALPLRDANNRIVRWFNLLTETDPREASTERLRQSAAILQKAFDEITNSEIKRLQAIDAIPVLAWSNLPDGRKEFLNKRWHDYTGLSPEESGGWGWQAAVHPDDMPAFMEKRSQLLASGEPGTIELRLRRFDGIYRWFLISVVPFRDETGQIVRWYGTSTDIDDRKQAEFYLSEGQRLAHIGSWTFTPAGFEHWSPELYAIFGLDPATKPPTVEEYIALVHPDDRAFVAQTIRTMLATHREFDFTKRIVRPDHSIRHLRCVGALAADSGSIQRFVGTGIDVTEHEVLTNALRKSEQELRQMLDLAPQMVAVLGPGRQRFHANRVALNYFGVTLEEWRERSLAREVHPDEFARVEALVEPSMANPAEFELEMRLRKGDGTYRWFLVRHNPLRDDHGQLIRWYVAGTDIDDRKLAEERLQRENVALREEIDKTSLFEEMVGASAALKAVITRVSKVAASDSTVLINGETGTGKELVARAIHRRSGRSSRAFVAVNCAAIPRDLIPSELFGHEKGAFTGATQRQLGRFELADGGTIFLDEVGELSPDTQVALLRVLQEREFERIGGRQSIRVDVRVIAATNRDLNAAVTSGAFRQDLFYRLNVFPLEMPPLRERREDIPLLVEYFIDRYARKAGKTIRRVNKQTLDRLQSYRWPGNVRELQNVIERSVIVCDTDEFIVDENWLSSARAVEGPNALSRTLAGHEKAIIEDALRASGGRVFGPSGAAARLGLSRSTLEAKIRAFGINKNHFRK